MKEGLKKVLLPMPLDARAPVLQEARDRGLGVIDIDKIDIAGDIESPKEMILEAFRDMNQMGKS